MAKWSPMIRRTTYLSSRFSSKTGAIQSVIGCQVRTCSLSSVVRTIVAMYGCRNPTWIKAHVGRDQEGLSRPSADRPGNRVCPLPLDIQLGPSNLMKPMTYLSYLQMKESVHSMDFTKLLEE